MGTTKRSEYGTVRGENSQGLVRPLHYHHYAHGCRGGHPRAKLPRTLEDESSEVEAVRRQEHAEVAGAVGYAKGLARVQLPVEVGVVPYRHAGDRFVRQDHVVLHAAAAAAAAAQTEIITDTKRNRLRSAYVLWGEGG